jgi:putative ABC transport system permease protein
VILKLILRNLFAHPVRTILTTGSVFLAVFLLCFLRATVSTLSASVENAASNRLWVQSAVSLFVNLPMAYENRISTVPGAEQVCKFQWFGGIYKEESNFFAQFGVDADRFQKTFPEIEIQDGSYEKFEKNRTGCIVGVGLAKKYGFKVGDTIPILGRWFGRKDGQPWEFNVEGIYDADSTTIDKETLYFHYKYLEETLRAKQSFGDEGVGVYVVRVADGVSSESVQKSINLLYENGPLKVNAKSEAEFNRQFLTMLGNVPMLLQSIGAAVLFAIFFAVLNTMLMAGRERTRDIGVMKALGFSDGVMFRSLVLESLVLSSIGGVLGVALAKGMEAGLADGMAMQFPGFAIDGETILIGLAISVGIGLLAGIAPGLRIGRLSPLQALREER